MTTTARSTSAGFTLLTEALRTISTSRTAADAEAVSATSTRSVNYYRILADDTGVATVLAERTLTQQRSAAEVLAVLETAARVSDLTRTGYGSAAPVDVAMRSIDISLTASDAVTITALALRRKLHNLRPVRLLVSIVGRAVVKPTIEQRLRD